MSSSNLSLLPKISFADQTPSQIEAEVIIAYEQIAGVTLQPADPVRLFLLSLAYLISVQNSVIDLAGKQSLLAYATEGHLDHVAALMGVSRLPAESARCVLRFSLGEPLAFAVDIPAGTRAATQDGKTVFATIASAEIEAGELSVEVAALATTEGSAANGLVAGQIRRLVDPVPYIVSVSNTIETVAGADEETDDALRERVRIAPESYTVAGPRGMYESLTKAVSQEITGVSVTTPVPGTVDIRFVLTGGELPDEAMIDMVQEALSAEDVRPLTDTVLVDAPDEIEYALDVEWYIEKSNTALLSSITAAVTQAVETYRIWQRSLPGRDINPTKLISLMEQAGARRVTVISPEFQELKPSQIARETTITVSYKGTEDV